MDLELHDRVAFVAGSSRGIGKAIAHALLREGARVAISGRDARALESCYSEFTNQFGNDRVLAISGDLTQHDAIARALTAVHDRWQRIDVLVANIGSGRSTPGWEIEDEAWASAFEMNFNAAVRIVTQTLALMLPAKVGSIVLVGSIAGVESTAAPLAYGSAKAALIAYTKNLARQVARDGVRVNIIAPGNIFFEGGSWEKHLHARGEAVEKYIHEEVPMQRFGTPEEVADVVAFLVSPRAAFMTGACIVADGGQTRRW